MKKLLILLFSILISFNSYGGWFDKTVCVKTDAQDRDGIIYLLNKTKPFSGKNLCKYENSQNKSKGKVKDGKKNDIWTEWYENGQISEEANYKDGKYDGKMTYWHQNGQMESELNEEHFEILKDGIHKLCVTTQNEFDTLSRYLGFSDTETHTHLTYILYAKNNPKMAAIELKVDDSELDILYKEFTELLNEDELNTLYENAEKYRAEYIEELVEKVNKERTKRLDYENYSVDLSAYLMLASNYALDANIAGRLKGKALIQEILDQKIADDAEEEEAKKYLEWF